LLGKVVAICGDTIKEASILPGDLSHQNKASRRLLYANLLCANAFNGTTNAQKA